MACSGSAQPPAPLEASLRRFITVITNKLLVFTCCRAATKKKPPPYIFFRPATEMVSMLLVCLSMVTARAVAGSPARNVLLITVDDLRPQLNLAYGLNETITPNLDRFARSGTVFHRAYCQQAVSNNS